MQKHDIAKTMHYSLPSLLLYSFIIDIYARMQTTATKIAANAQRVYSKYVNSVHTITKAPIASVNILFSHSH